ncbi:MAG: hypothetical protein LKG27_06680 [Clostridiaceae bacterium]|jgi:hypothetical protein|nr:hypothetical protein [Clostridiaceae bacterium]
MNIFKNKKVGNIRTVSFLGIQLYKTEDSINQRVQHILGNLIYTKRLRTGIKEKKIFKILNFPISKRVLENDTYQYYFLNKLVKRVLLPEHFYNCYLKKIKIKFDDVYILQCNSGEIYLFFAYIVKSLLQKKSSKNPLFIATQAYHIDIMKMYFPNAKYVYLKDLRLKTQSNQWYYNGHKIYMIFSGIHLEHVELDVKNKEIGTVHYLKNIMNTLDLTPDDFTEPNAIISLNTKNSLSNKINNMQLKINKFVILAPEAKTCIELPFGFWNNIALELSKKGFDIFLNITDKKNLITNCKTDKLDFAELYCLAQKAKAIISLRSGLSEFVLPTNIPNIAIYTKFRDRNPDVAFSVERGIAGFSMLKMPFINEDKIIEINADKYKTLDELKEVTIKSFESLTNIEENL